MIVEVSPDLNPNPSPGHKPLHARAREPQVRAITPESPIVRRLWARTVIAESGCLLWSGPLDVGGGRTGSKGYPRVWETKAEGGKRWRAARLVATAFYGPIPKGYEPDHLCRDTACLNWDHLEVVTHAENKRREGQARRETNGHRCGKGHLMTQGNIIWNPPRKPGYSPTQACKTCRQERKRQGRPHQRASRPRAEMPTLVDVLDAVRNGHDTAAAIVAQLEVSPRWAYYRLQELEAQEAILRAKPGTSRTRLWVAA